MSSMNHNMSIIYLFTFHFDHFRSKMSLIRYNHRLFSHLISSTCRSSIFIRHATEIRSRKPVENNRNVKQRKNTVNPIAQVKKLGDKAGRLDLNTFVLNNLNGIHLYIFSQSTFQ